VAEDGSKNGHLELSEWCLEVWWKGLYIVVGSTFPPHLYLLSELLDERYSEEIWRFWENEAVDSGLASFRLVVLSSYIEVGFQFVGRACTKGRTRVFMGVDPLVRRCSENMCARVRGCYPDSCAWVRPSGGQRRAWYVHLFATQLCMGVWLCSGHVHCDTHLCS
jgi:hypothetical protein